MAEHLNLPFTKLRLIKTVCLVTAWLSAGMYIAMIGPALIDLTEIVHCDYEQIALALTAKNIGFPTAALIAGFLCSRNQRHLEAVLGVNLIILGLSTAAIPWCTLLPVMAIAMMFQGLSHGVLGIAGNTWVAVMWEGKSSAPLHALHFGNAFGAVLAPLIIRPFLSPDANRTTYSNQSLSDSIDVNSSDFVNITGNSSANDTSTHIQIPYGAYGLYTVIWGIFFVVFYIKDKRSSTRLGIYHFEQRKIENKTSKKKKDAPTTGTIFGVQRSFGLFMVLTMLLLFVGFVGVDNAVPTYLMPMGVNGRLHLLKAEVSLVLFGYWVSRVVGRLIATIITHWFPLQAMFFVEVVTTLGIAIALNFFAFDSLTLLWVLTCGFSFVTAPLFPSGMAWTELYLEIKGPFMAVFFVGAGLGALIVQWVSGYGVQNISVDFPIDVNLGSSIAVAVLYIIAMIRACSHGKRSVQYGDNIGVDSDDNYSSSSDYLDERRPLIN